MFASFPFIFVYQKPKHSPTDISHQWCAKGFRIPKDHHSLSVFGMVIGLFFGHWDSIPSTCQRQGCWEANDLTDFSFSFFLNSSSHSQLTGPNSLPGGRGVPPLGTWGPMGRSICFSASATFPLSFFQEINPSFSFLKLLTPSIRAIGGLTIPLRAVKKSSGKRFGKFCATLPPTCQAVAEIFLLDSLSLVVCKFFAFFYLTRSIFSVENKALFIFSHRLRPPLPFA